MFVLQENIIDKTENLTKENQSYKSIVCMACNLQGQDVGVHSFIALLNSHRLSSSFISSSLSSQILGPRNLILSVPLKVVHTEGM